MKGIGTKQFLSKKFELIDLSDEFKTLLGELPKNFIGIIYGESGNGKSELTLRLMKELTKNEKGAYLSYEQMHSYSLQRAIERNNMDESIKSITWFDPLSKLPPDKSMYDDLVETLSRRGFPRVVVIDSLDYLGLTKEQYHDFKSRFNDKKQIIFIAHAKGNHPEQMISRKVRFDGEFGILVKDFIARPYKSRLGADTDYIIWEEGARRRNPLYFAKRDADALKPQPKKRGRKPKNKQ